VENTAAVQPVRYDPSVEQPSKGEAEAIQGLSDTFKQILETTSQDYGRAVRGVHAKGHGIVRGRLTVKQGLSPQLAQGLFASEGTYEAMLRFSTAPGDILDDSVSSPRGIGLKIFGVQGERLPGSEGDTTQDFLLVNGPVFGAPTPAAFLGNLKMLAASTDKAEGLKKAWSATLRAVENVVEALGGSSVLLQTLGGAPEVHPLGETYYSQAAFRYGDHIAKFSLTPISTGLTERTGDKVAVAGRPDALREGVGEVMIEQGGTWALCVQLCTDLEKMPVEDPTVEWDEKMSPFVPVATFEVEPQIAWRSGASERTEDALSFSPWHGLAAFQPLGAINRARKPTYEYSKTFRGDFNKCPIHEAARLADIPA
jgi:hypothetical protein